MIKKKCKWILTDIKDDFVKNINSYPSTVIMIKKKII